MIDLLQCLKPNQRTGSKPRCHRLTSGRSEQVAERLTRLIAPDGSVTASDRWMPQGFESTDEAQLHNAPRLLDVHPHGEELKRWWLAVAGPTSTTPNWDIASTCTIDGKHGLLLVEAKAHHRELKSGDRCGATNQENREQIRQAVGEANDALNNVRPGWSLSPEPHYQLSNRFAWSWKLASLGFPVALVYLGFLRANEMRDFLPDEQSWRDAVRDYARNIVPEGVWGGKLMIGDTPLYVFIRSMEMSLDPIADPLATDKVMLL
jgi:hypothetical protein